MNIAFLGCLDLLLLSRDSTQMHKLIKLDAYKQNKWTALEPHPFSAGMADSEVRRKSKAHLTLLFILLTYIVYV